MQNQNTREVSHRSVLKDEVSELLEKERYAPLNIQARLIDATVGLGGHAEEFVKSGWQVLGIDVDKEAIEVAEEVLKQARLRQVADATKLKRRSDYGGQACPTRLSRKTGPFKLIQDSFKDIKKIAQEHGFNKVEAILFDLGVSVPQLTSKTRGFSFQSVDAALDMRLGKTTQNVSAADLLNALSEKQLIKLFGVVMPLNISRRIANRVVDRRKIEKFRKVGDFVDVIENDGYGRSKLNPATLPFMALRIAVNSELDILQMALPDAFSLLAVGGRLAVISFHSGEDKIVKHIFKSLEGRSKGIIITKKPITPTRREVILNPRARSAKLRVIRKI